MVFIHGGAFFLGSGSKDFYGPDRILDYDVVSIDKLNSLSLIFVCTAFVVTLKNNRKLMKLYNLIFLISTLNFI